MDKFTINDWLDINKSLEKAREDDTPHAVLNNGNLAVVGDANKTEVKKVDYQIKFRFEEGELQAYPKNAKKVGKYIMFTIDFEDIHINPRKDMLLVESALGIYPIITALTNVVDTRNSQIEEMLKKVGAEYTKDDDGQITLSQPNKQLEDEIEVMKAQANIEMIHVYNQAGEQGQQAIYDFVKTLLNIDDVLADHMLPGSVLNALYATIVNNPEIFNETETVFGY
jgi:hypothetical protein|nr:MAG TPA: hypothetical protein [Caudoviricetes sp.]